MASHRELASSRPQGTAAVRVVTPTIADAGWSASGHSVVEVVTDDMPFLVDSVTMELDRPATTCTRSSTRSSPSSATSPASSSTCRPEADAARQPSARRRRARVVDARRDRPRSDDDEARRDRPTTLQRVLRDVREAVEDWAQDARPGRGRRRRARRPTRRRCDAEEVRQGRDFLTLAGRRPLHLPRLPRVPARGERRRRRAACAPSPAPASASCAPTRTCRASFGQAAAAGQGQGPREDAAGAGQGQLARDRAPPGVPRLRRREDVRRGRRGRRRAPLPRPVLQRRLHRVA